MEKTRNVFSDFIIVFIRLMAFRKKASVGHFKQNPRAQ